MGEGREPPRRRRWRGLAVAALMALLMALPWALRLPAPGGQALTVAELSLAAGGAAQTLPLPHAWPATLAPGPQRAQYRLRFDVPDGAPPQYLFVAQARLELEAELNGRRLELHRAAAWAAPLSPSALWAALPDGALRPRGNELTLRLQRERGFRGGYLSVPHVGSAAEVLPAQRLRALVADGLRLCAVVLPALLTAAVGLLYAGRRRDAVYGWLALLGLGGLMANLAELGVPPGLDAVQRTALVVALTNFSAIVAYGLARRAVGRPQPRGLPWAVAGLPLASCAALWQWPEQRLLAVAAGLLSLAWMAAAIGVLWRAWRASRNPEFAALALALALVVWYSLVDMATLAGVSGRGFLLLPYPQTLLTLAVAAGLLRRLLQSTNRLDAANDHLRQRLAEREAQLAQAHAHERTLADAMAREQERERLMRDLHDGLSGHIVAIIALAERERVAAIEQAARDALDDLRLVIHSLDIGSEEIDVVLAYFRERTAPQLRRLGVALDWRMEALPAIAGVTAGHALSLLRILQEAVTNALRHGPARRIAIRGEATPQGGLRLTVDNDGCKQPPRRAGNGLANLQRRAASLGGQLALEATAQGMRLSVALPPRLPRQSPDPSADPAPTIGP